MGLDELTLKAQYVYSVILVSVYDYDDLYDDLVKNAIKYGISIRDFWNMDDYKLYFLYEESYYEKLHEQKHLQGLYNFIAFNTIISNAFRDSKKGGKPLEYPDENIYIQSKNKMIKEKTTNKITKQKINSNNLNLAFQQRLLECY